MQDAHLTLPASAAAPAVARVFLRCLCQEWGTSEEVGQAAELLATELVTNAVVHAASGVRLAATLTADTLHVDVSDLGAAFTPLGMAGPEDPATQADPALAAQPPSDEPADSGRGLAIVSQVARTWGVHESGRFGKTVWFELATT